MYYAGGSVGIMQLTNFESRSPSRTKRLVTAQPALTQILI